MSSNGGHGKILLSDVEVTRKRKLFWGRKWRSLDLKMGLGMLGFHILALFAPFTFTRYAFWFSFLGYVLTLLFGITLGYHRVLAHHSVKLPKWLEYSCAYLGVLAAKYQERRNVEDLKSQAFYRLHLFGSGALVYAWGGFSYLIWIMGFRITLTYNVTFIVNSVCHIWGKRVWNTDDLSQNNWWMALLAFGEGWHNNHHAFEYSARHGLEWWQIDVVWYTIQFLESVGLATNVKVPTEAQKLK